MEEMLHKMHTFTDLILLSPAGNIHKRKASIINHINAATVTSSDCFLFNAIMNS